MGIGMTMMYIVVFKNFIALQINNGSSVVSFWGEKLDVGSNLDSYTILSLTCLFYQFHNVTRILVV